MDFTVYVPDDLGERLKSVAPKVNFSALFREAAKSELDRLDRTAEMAGDAQEFELDMRLPEGTPYVGVIRGEQLTNTHNGCTFYLTDDGRVLAYYDKPAEGEPYVVQVENAGVQSGYASNEDFIKVAAALGEKARCQL